jgi:ABC-type transporter Mla subunit MlaD
VLKYSPPSQKIIPDRRETRQGGEKMPAETEHISVQAVQQLYDGLSESNRQTIDTMAQVLHETNGTREALRNFCKALENLTVAIANTQEHRKED